MTVASFEVLPEVVALGVAFGLVYGLLAVGLVLAYRASGVINFAHADIGVAVATVFAVAVTRWHTPYWLALPLALALGAVVGGMAHVAVVRRLEHVPRLISVVATLGLGQVLLLGAAAVAGAAAAAAFPEPPGLPAFDLGALHVRSATSAMLIGGPVAVILLWAWLARSRNGLEVRAAAANPAAARLLGLPAARLSALVWGVAGSLAVLTAVFVGAAPRFIGGNVSGPGLLVRALAAGVLARMHSLPAALAAGLSIGVLEQTALWNTTTPGIVDVLLFALVVVALLVQRDRGEDREAAFGWVRLAVWRPLPPALAEAPAVRRAFRLLSAGAVLVAVLLPAVVSNSTAVTLTAIVAFATVGLSVGIVSGLAGKLSLGQFAIAGVGAVASVHVVAGTGNFALGFAAAAAAGVLTAVVAGLPALRIHGPFLAVTTLAFALAAETWLLGRPWALGGGADAGKPVIAAVPLDTGRRYYIVALVVGGAVLWLARNVHRSGLGRRLVAVRDNERASAAFGIDARATMFLGFALGGAVAGVGGAVYGHALAVVTPSAFPVSASVAVVAMAVIGGIGMLLGPLFGALYIIGVPALLPLDAAWLAATAFGWLVLVLYVPAGLAEPLRVLRDRFAAMLSPRVPTDAPAPAAPLSDEARVVDRRLPPVGVGRRAIVTERAAAVLEGTALRRTFGGVRAVDGVDVTVGRGEVVGVIGPNGAGKTTLLNLLSGALRPEAGTVHLEGNDVTALAAHRRARLGVARSFQATVLFPTLTVLDALRVAQELDSPTPLASAVLGPGRRELEKTDRGREALAVFGLESYAEVPVHALSTGTRRVCELACLALLEPRVMLLDEPSAGLAQPEVDRLAPLLLRLRDQLETSLVIVEHDVRLVTAVADRVLTMADGRVLRSTRSVDITTSP